MTQSPQPPIGPPPALTPELMAARLAGVRVVHKAADWLAIDKPAGVLSVPGKGEVGAISVVSWVKERYPHATGPITVHRLDMDTSGLLLVALTPQAQRSLSMLFESRAVEKCYVAVVAGRVAQPSGVFDAPMRLDVPNRPRQVIDFDQGKPARTEFHVLDATDDRTRLKLVPLTGRTHQLRLHCAHAGHPILGDVIYGERTSAPRLLLHAERLVLADPQSRQLITIESPAPF